MSTASRVIEIVAPDVVSHTEHRRMLPIISARRAISSARRIYEEG
jgi:uncharacterized DUF497 family protein